MAFIEKQIERIFRRHYGLTKRLRLRTLAQGLPGRPPLVIYTSYRHKLNFPHVDSQQCSITF
ncbi:hypothetical protein BDD21_4997 [Thiocapsa rosea]|uniref:Uncharacterized protein n=1 Tax=Thiocapsa rosea TaxID=69360 RepID=A0A495VFR6_9GAMM|nr:hypothetical protein BDD21_4997 [Thiocapsa rosea]